jgi:hypothetical protein
MADLCSHLLDCVVIDEGVKMKGSDTQVGKGIVKKIRRVYRVPMDLHRRAVYQYHLQAEYIDRNFKPAPGARLQALRVAAAAPDSDLLEPRPTREADRRASWLSFS